ADALSWSELSKLDAGSWHSAVYAGEPVPPLAAIARWSIANDVACNIEIKPMPGRERDTGAAVALDARALWKETSFKPLLSSFSEEALAAARDAVPELERALLLERVPKNWLDRLSLLGCIALDGDYRELDEARVAAAHAAGYRVLTYTPNDPEVVSRL